MGKAKLLRIIARLVSQRPHEMQRGLDRAARTVDRKTGGKYSHQIDRGVRTAGRYLHGRGRGHGHGGDRR